MVHIDPATGTVVLNAATVPRVVSLPHSNGEWPAPHRDGLNMSLSQSHCHAFQDGCC